MNSISNYIFLSHLLDNETVGYGGKKNFSSKQILSLSKNDSCNQSEWSMSNHIGTHIDVPYHFNNHGSTVDMITASNWIFLNPQLIETRPNKSTLIEVDEWCESINLNADLLLLKTGFEQYRNTEDYWAHNPGFSPDLALWLRKYKPNLRAIGFDFISITSYDYRSIGKLAHQAFLGDGVGNPIMAVEDMHLRNLEKSPRKVIISPLRVLGADGSPVTVIAEL